MMNDTSLIADWQGDRGHYVIDVSDNVVSLECEKDDLWDVVSMSRADALAVIAGLQNAVAALDDDE